MQYSPLSMSGGGIKSRLSIQKLDVYMGLYHLHEEKGEKVEDDRQ